MANLSPLDLVQGHAWDHATFTTYALSLSFVEAVLLDALVRGGGRDLLVVADVDGIRGALGEQGARRAGRDYEVEPIKVPRGVFHAKVGVLSSRDEAHLLIGSGNLTFNGWGGNLEVLEHLHPSFAADAFLDAAVFFERLAADEERVRHGVSERFAITAVSLRAAAAQHSGGRGDIRVLHSFDRAILDQIVELSADLGGPRRLTAAAPYWDDGRAIDRLAGSLGLEEVFVHAHPGGAVMGSGVANWPLSASSGIRPVRIHPFDEDVPRRMHAKAFEILCRRGRLLVSGSANATSAALGGAYNIEACVARIQKEQAVGWQLTATDPPDLLVSDPADDSTTNKLGVLRATLNGDEIVGRVLTSGFCGPARAVQLTSEDACELGLVDVDPDGDFAITAPGLELQSWRGGRFTLKLETETGAAEGFVSIAAFSAVTRLSGAFAPRLLALLTGSEAPADVAAIMTWLHEDPARLRPTAMAVGGGASAARQTEFVAVPVSELQPAFAATRAGGHLETDGLGQAGWSRFMAQVFAALKEPRGPFPHAKAGPAAEHLGDDENPAEEVSSSQSAPDPEASRALSNFERLLELLLEPHNAPRHAIDAFYLANYICDRLSPDQSVATAWLERIVETLLASPPNEPARRADIASAIVLLSCRSAEPQAAVRARGRLLRLGYGVDAVADASLVGFERVVPQIIGRAEAWALILAHKTIIELVQSYIASLRLAAPSGDFERLEHVAPDAWPILWGALTSERSRKQVIIAARPTDACPSCHQALPSSETHRMRSLGIALAKNCCDRVIICEAL